MVVGGDFVVENVDQIEALLEPALIVAERKKQLEFLDNETIGNRRSWIWADETVRFFGVRAQSRLLPRYRENVEQRSVHSS